MSKRPRLGQFCIVTSLVLSCSEWLGDEERLNKFKIPRQDDRWKYPFRRYLTHKEITPMTAMYVGLRVLHEGVTSLEWADESISSMYPVFKHKSSRVAWLFVKNERSNPFLVFPEHVVFTTEGGE